MSRMPRKASALTCASLFSSSSNLGLHHDPAARAWCALGVTVPAAQSATFRTSFMALAYLCILQPSNENTAPSCRVSGPSFLALSRPPVPRSRPCPARTRSAPLHRRPQPDPLPPAAWLDPSAGCQAAGSVRAPPPATREGWNMTIRTAAKLASKYGRPTRDLFEPPKTRSGVARRPRKSALEAMREAARRRGAEGRARETSGSSQGPRYRRPRGLAP